MSLVSYIEHHPAIAFIVAVSHILFSRWIEDIHIPQIFIQMLQSGSYLVAIIVGCISIYGFIKNKKKGTLKWEPM